MENIIKTKILLKTDTVSNWAEAAKNNFKPMRGEVCIYLDNFSVYKEDGETVDYYLPGIKIGDGATNIADLPFLGGPAVLF